MTSSPSRRLRRIALAIGLFAVVLLVLAACSPIAPSAAPGATVAPGATAASTVAPTPSPAPTALIVSPVALDANPVAVLAWLFNPIFQLFLIMLVGIYGVVGDMGIAIIVTTLLVRTALVPLMRRQMVSMRRMQAIAPEIKEIQRRFKGDRVKVQQATAALYKERGVSQAGCLTAMLPIVLILPMYQVVPLTCPPPHLVAAANGALHYAPCIDSAIPWLGGIHASLFEGLINLPFSLPLIGAGISMFALFYTGLQLIASRMALPPHNPNIAVDSQAKTQRSLSLWLPLITILYGSAIPVGVFLYLIVSTIYQIIQQFLTTGWGGMFPLFGRTPAFAVDHSPRVPVAVPSAIASSSRPAGAPARPNPERSALDRTASANATIRQRGRQGRRGRRR